MKDELRRGATMTSNITEMSDFGENIWDQLCERTDFFTRYRHYLMVEIGASNEEEFHIWQGWILSRIRQLILVLQETQNVWCAQPLLEAFVPPAPLNNDAAVDEEEQQKKKECYFLGLRFGSQNLQNAQSKSQIRAVDLTPALANFMFQIRGFTLCTPGMIVSLKHLRRSELPQFVLEQNAVRMAKSHKRAANTGVESVAVIASQEPQVRKIADRSSP
jgi:poly(A) polymerase